MTPADVATLVLGDEPMELDNDALVESAVLLVKVSNANGTSSIHRIETDGMSYWEMVGLLQDASDHARGIKIWDGGDHV